LLKVEEIKRKFYYRNGFLINKRTKKKAGSVKPSGYVQVKVKGKMYAVHRLIFMLFHGYLPETVDHIDGNPSNNKKENLRAATRKENSRNRRSNKSKQLLKGVSNNHGRFRARIRVSGKSLNLGTFKTEIEAHEAYCKAAEKHYKEFKCLK
jgi:hypothetical protein